MVVMVWIGNDSTLCYMLSGMGQTNWCNRLRILYT